MVAMQALRNRRDLIAAAAILAALLALVCVRISLTHFLTPAAITDASALLAELEPQFKPANYQGFLDTPSADGRFWRVRFERRHGAGKAEYVVVVPSSNAWIYVWLNKAGIRWQWF